MKRSKIFLGISALALGYGVAASAQTAPPERQNPEEVVVTAEHRSVNVQKTALSVSVINGDQLADHGKTTVGQVLASVPGIQIQGAEGGNSSIGVTGGGGPPNVSIRGLGTDGPNKSSSTAFYVDGVLWVGGGGEFYDVERVEVLRGPQGTLYGRGATGGAVNVIARNPVLNKTEVDARLQLGSKSLIGFQGIVNVPVSDTVAIRASVNSTKHDGYLSNGQNDQDDINARLKLLIKPSNDFSILLGSTTYSSNNLGTEAVIPAAVPTLAQPNASAGLTAAEPQPKDWVTIRGTIDNHAKIDYQKIYANVEWNLGPVLLTYIPSYQTTNSFVLTNSGATPTSTNHSSTDHPYDRTTTHELRFSNPEGSALTWDAGIFLYHSTYRQEFRSAASVAALATAFPSLQIPTQDSKAIYGEATYAFSPTLRGTIGLRESRDDVGRVLSNRGIPVPTSFKSSFSHFDWKARLESNLSENSLLYGMVSTGYRPGGVVNGHFYDNEIVKAYEIGTKTKFNNGLLVNAAGFYYDYSGFQTPQSECIGGTFPNCTVVTEIMAGPAKIYGLDLELAYRLTPNDKVTLTPQLIRGKYTANIVGLVPGSTHPVNVATNGKDLAHLPKFSLGGSYTHSFDLASGAVVTADIDFHYQSDSLTDFDISNYPTPNPIFQQPSWTMWNASATYVSPSGNYTVTLYGKNLTNNIHKLAVFSGPPPAGAVVNDPRTFGVILSTHF